MPSPELSSSTVIVKFTPRAVCLVSLIGTDTLSSAARLRFSRAAFSQEETAPLLHPISGYYFCSVNNTAVDHSWVFNPVSPPLWTYTCHRRANQLLTRRRRPLPSRTNRGYYYSSVNNTAADHSWVLLPVPTRLYKTNTYTRLQS